MEWGKDEHKNTLGQSKTVAEDFHFPYFAYIWPFLYCFLGSPGSSALGYFHLIAGGKQSMCSLILKITRKQPNKQNLNMTLQNCKRKYSLKSKTQFNAKIIF